MNFTDLQNGVSEGYCIVKTVEQKLNVKGVPYLDFVLSDSAGEINAKLWDYKESVHGRFEPGDFIKVRGTLSKYNGVDQFRVERIRPVTSDDNVDIGAFVPSAEYAGEMMMAKLYSYVDSMKDEELQRITRAILQEREAQLLFWPAAYKLHHAMRGGLLYHTISIVKLASAVCRLYPAIDRDLLLAGAILHDVCKLEEFEVNSVGIVSQYSVKGELLGHLVMGAMLIREKAQELGVREETAVLLEHMIISHHGTPEFGAAVRPMFLEAEVLSQLDTLDATVFEITSAVSAVEEQGFSGRQWALDNRKLFNHGRKASIPKANLE